MASCRRDATEAGEGHVQDADSIRQVDLDDIAFPPRGSSKLENEASETSRGDGGD